MKTNMIIILAFVITVHSQNFGLGLGASNSQASTTTSYFFGISLDGSSGAINIQSGTQITISFPTDYTNRLTTGATTCSLLSWGDGSQTPIPTPSCSISGNSVVIDSLFTQTYSINSYFDITLQIDNIKNPLASGLTGNFIAYLPTVSGTQTISATGISISAVTMTCSATTTPTTVNQNGEINIQFTTP